MKTTDISKKSFITAIVKHLDKPGFDEGVEARKLQIRLADLLQHIVENLANQRLVIGVKITETRFLQQFKMSAVAKILEWHSA